MIFRGFVGLYEHGKGTDDSSFRSGHLSGNKFPERAGTSRQKEDFATKIGDYEARPELRPEIRLARKF